ncbi:hypothetical protein N5P37_007387 [Trichoderma harzianum]|uniref:Zn(2)-C6 fungal-type domain-containing protein n=4 Tax=Trichoderma TaxID=5543 RepID=A0A2T4ALN9_TRIHA|nr:hypothetical protein M431DRAFT_491998 [Trichoderma harzianum CBS 226.95]KAF3076838.1 hypothetical protein CFAM422_000372 [Trichoderma lentiforme]KAK0760304.1 hypothetical protein N5P37_007387 [Trichoderma harzianum]QYS94620.1 hypothetical protein H0G86_001949 [Trichoderma simmonsii]KAK4076117.1 transcriptional regulator family: Fungal Specific TF [Trichoderma harzianum]PKK51726.1 hypothetical protein CI102_4255 [Trichoderma harzianum]
MPHMREVKTCDRCRHFKRRCDLLKPSCSRCIQAGVRCSFDVNGVAVPGAVAAAANGATSASPNSSRQARAATALASSPPVNGDPAQGIPGQNGLISPTASTESPEPHAVDANGMPIEGAATGAAAANQLRVVRKRKRNCLSCLRCHRLKVKCDKELPCGRCKSSGNGRECYYSYNKGPNGGKFPCPTAPSSNSEETTTVLATWQVQHKVRGSSHWRDLMTKIGTLTTLESAPLAAALEDVATNACLANFTLPGNFPFGTPGASKYYTRDAVTRLLASERANHEKYLQRYLELLDVVNPIVDIHIFRREIERYWMDPNASDLCWLAQFLMVMGLGSFASPEGEPPVATELMMAAEACLMQTPFSFRPTLLALKTLALMVVAKQVCNPTCWSVDSCWSLLGLLVRTAFIYGLPQDPSSLEDEGRNQEEKDSRRKLWLTILYLDVKVAMCTGMPPLTRPDELGTLEKIPDWGPPDSLQMVLYQSLPTVLAVMAQINSNKEQISYPDVLRYNAQLRELMSHAQRVCTGQLQRTTVDIFLRRCLMVLHRPFALHPEGPVMFPESYWSSLECCLALLVHYREMWAGEPHLRLDLVGRAFVLDFFSATLTTYIHVLRADAPLTGAAAMGCAIPPRQIILDTLRSCVDIWSSEKDKSVCYRTGYNLVVAVLNLVPKNKI